MLGSLVFWVTLPVGVGFTSSAFMKKRTASQYASIDKPSWAPPAWVFAPVWTVLYVLMGLAAFLVWKARGSTWSPALTWFVAQLLLNGLWTPVFFGMNSPKLALAILLSLLADVVKTTAEFWKIDGTAGKLMVPYVLWSSYASALNASIALKY